MIGIYSDELKALVREVVVSVLNEPVPATPAVGSIYDILRDLDARLPDRGHLLTDAKADEMGLSKPRP